MVAAELGGRTFLVTGANSGIGRALVEALAARGGNVVLASRSEERTRPVVDAIRQRRVRWFSWAAMWISLMAVVVVLSDAGNFKLSFPALLDVGAYLTAYFFKFQFMTKLA